MRRSLFRYTNLLFLPLLALGLVLAGCDSSGSNGPGDPEDTDTNAYPESGSYEAEIVSNLLTTDIRGKIDGADVEESTLLELYTGDIGDKTIAAASGITTEGQSTYDDIAGDVDLSAKLASDLTRSLVEGDALEAGVDAPSDAGSDVNADDLIRFYFQDVATNDRFTTPNGVHMGQLSEKLLASAIYGEAARILTDFADDPSSVDDPAEKWDAAFGYYGAPRDFEESFLDLENGEGLVDGSANRDVDGDGVDLRTERVYTWAGYTAERAAAAEANSPNNFAGRAFEGFREGRKAIEDDNLDALSGPDGYAAQARDAWEATVAVNVIHYINGLEADLEELGDDQTVEDGDLDEDAWGEAKAFAWGLQFYSDELSSSQLQTIHEDIGSAPPYGEKTASTYADELSNATQIIADAYGFNATNVEEW